MSIKNGSKVKIEYTGSLDDGTVFDSTTHGDHTHPLEFTIGEGKILPKFEKEVMGMKKGGEKKFRIEAKDAYGEYNESAKKEFPKSMLPKEREPEKGMVLMLQSPEGHMFPVKIADVTNDKIVLDLNHPLAGKALNFKIKVIEVE